MGRGDALRLAYFVRLLRASIVGFQCQHCGAIVGRLVRRGAIASAIVSALHCADSMLCCALPTRAHFHYPPYSAAIPRVIPRVIPLPFLSFESYLEMMLQE